MSSSVTRPSTSPYSSTTSANGVLRRRNALSCSETARVSGTNQGGVSSAGDVDLLGIAVDRMQRAQQILHVQHADDVLRIAAPERNARHRRRDHRVDQVFAASRRHRA